MAIFSCIDILVEALDWLKELSCNELCWNVDPQYCKHNHLFCSQILHGNIDQTLINPLHGLLNFESLFSKTQKVSDPCGQPIYIQEQCSTFDIDKDT